MSFREVELKLAIASADDYQRLCEALPGFEDQQTQRNIYFDDQRRLADQRMMLRLRIEPPSATLTLKIGTSTVDGVFDSEEIEDPIRLDRALALEAEARAIFRIESIVIEQTRNRCEGPLESLVEWGRLHNRRRRYRVTPEMLVEVDETEFPGGVLRWEVEVEGDRPDQAREWLDRLASGVGVTLQTQTLSKSQFLTAHLKN
ncbi:MAG: CYTH domain-containing protein [Planctomycetota bacterium]|nr:CYTH domain-containing protein [Planctomycetota bacterium]